ncbi:hypothetical protein KL919_004661 [Ogataea angusta]|uniref:Uncharacterized protein n=1 Tax=Pichia angusta TaxID=870730 RepID=A0AAN6I3U2_PICAN|nr:uncharacterized protein KL928_004835 [Ogataea angusta]KAG7816279.1 hypothetical protein KL928_004835 [Ogataea angusta]KAG7822451.1 hypothetical protein KL909_004139 [Ogataea angusta]KAG7843677.1 hypothetical protein KL941_004659 [Ogataea angusta]KAG7855521.1 hypothetical protein KL919_004661 [Ogataea angusta]
MSPLYPGRGGIIRSPRSPGGLILIRGVVEQMSVGYMPDSTPKVLGTQQNAPSAAGANVASVGTPIGILDRAAEQPDTAEHSLKLDSGDRN